MAYKSQILNNSEDDDLYNQVYNEESPPSSDDDFLKLKVQNQDQQYEMQKRREKRSPYERLFKSSESWPSCFEKSLVKCLYYLSREKTLLGDYDNFEVSKLIQECEFLRERLKVEGFDTNENQKFLDNLKHKLENKSWQSAYKELESKYKNLRSLDIEKIRGLVQEIDKAEAMLKDKDIILLLGPTGCGKSTTLHFLAGSKMQKVKRDGVGHIEPYENEYDPTLLERVTTSPLAESETQYIATTEIVYQKAGIAEKGSIFLCDTPGFEDTNGAEVDIANGVGIVKIIKNCKSVRPVIFISGKDYESSRMQGLRKLANILVGMIYDIKALVASFSFFLTMFTDEQKEEFEKKLDSLLESILNNQNYENNESFLLFFDQLKSSMGKSRRGAKFINPIEDERADLLRFLKTINPILRPSEVFQFSVSRESHAQITDQMRKHQITIFSSMEMKDFKFVEFKLEEMKFLKDLIQRDHLNQIYQECIEYIKNAANKHYLQVKNEFNQALKFEISDERFLKNYEAEIERGKLLDKIREKFEIKEIPSSYVLDHNLLEQFRILLNEIDSCQLDDVKLKTNLDKIKMVSNFFNKINYDTKCLENKTQQVERSFKEHIEKNHYDDCARLFLIVENSIKLLAEHKNKLPECLVMMEDELKEHLQGFIARLDEIFKKTYLQSSDIDNISASVVHLKCAEDAFKRIGCLTLDINSILNQFVIKVNDRFNKINDDVVSSFKKDFSAVEQLFEQMTMLVEISTGKNESTRKYYSTLEALCGHIESLKLDINNIITTDLTASLKLDQLSQLVCQVEDAKWIENYKQGCCNEVIEYFKSNINNRFLAMKASLFELKLDLDNYDNISRATLMFEKICDLKFFDRFIIGFSSVIEEIKKWFENNINQAIAQINYVFIPQNKEKTDFLRLLHIQIADNALKYLNSCIEIEHLIAIDTKQVLFKLETHIKQHTQLVKNETDAIFSRISIYSGKDREELFQNCLKLYDRFRELNEIKKYPELSKRFNQNLFENLKIKLKEYAIGLNDEVDLFKITKAIAPIHIKFDIAKGLRQLDEFLENKTFETIYKNIFKLVMDEAPSILQNVNEAIKTENFPRLSQILNDLSSSEEPAFQYYYNESKYALNFEINRCIKEVTGKAQLFSTATKDDNIFNEIRDKLILLENCKELSNFIDNAENINKCKETVKKYFQEAFLDTLTSIETSAKGFKLTEANDGMKIIKRKIFMLKNIIFKDSDFADIEKKCIEIENLYGKDSEYLKMKYRNTKLDDFIYESPKHDFEKLKANNLLYSDIANELRAILSKKFNERMEAIKFEKKLQDKKDLIRNLKLILNNFPEGLDLELKERLEELEQNIVQYESDLINELNHALVYRDYNTLEANMPFYKEAGLQSIYMKTIIEFFQKEMYEYSEKIKVQIKNNELLNVIESYRIFSAHKTFCEKHLPSKNINTCYQIGQKFKETVDQMVSDIVTFFEEITDPEKPHLINDNQLKNIDTLFCILANIYIISQKDEKLVEELSPSFLHTYLKIAGNITAYAYRIKDMFAKAIVVLDISKLKSALDNIRHSLKIFHIKVFLNNIPKNEVHTYFIDESTYNNFLKQTEQKIIELRTFFEQIDLTAPTSEHERNIFYVGMNKKVQIARQIYKLSEHQLNYHNIKSFEKEISEILSKKCDNILNALKNIVNKEMLTSRDCDDFSAYYTNIFCLMKHVKLPNIVDPLVLKNIENKLFEIIDQNGFNIENKEIKDTAARLITMKTISDKLTMFRKEIDEKIDAALKAFKNKRSKEGGIALSRLGTILNADIIGKKIINEHSIFEGYALAMFNDKVQKHKIGYVLDNLSGDLINISKLEKRYQEFEKIYQKLVKDNLNPKFNLSEFVGKISLNFKKAAVTIWDLAVTQNLPELIAHLFALWTLSDCKHYFENEGVENQSSYLLQPHPAQVISIFRLLGVGDDKEVLTNNLCQIGTGEGKSVILAVTACVFAIYGYHVSCACYSEYLSQRDYNAFLPMFQLLNIDSQITYGTFTKTCENILNYDGDVREKVLNFVNNNIQEKVERKTSRKQILLIDEVDVFLNKGFYGNIYSPIANLKNSIKSLVDLVWTRREDQLSFNFIKKTKEYTDCIEKYGEWSFLIEEAVKTMIIDVKRFETPAYIVENDKIGYVKLDGISFNTVHRYKTLFAYYHENQKRNISDESLNENVCVQIKCGDYSYAEIPHQFEYIMGVTGTLKTLSIPEKEIVEKAYKIKKKTYTPSVFGKNNLRFVEQNDVFIETSNDYHNRILREIECRLKGKNEGTQRAVLVFFESRKELLKFYNSNTFFNMKENSRILTEEDNLTLLEKDKFIKDATRSGAISLITRSFGRGTDFVCRDDIVLANGGVHVLQTFLSEQLSEEIQIKGRTARQGDLGSYSMVLLDKSLEKFSITIEDIQENQANIYKLINEKRNAYFESQYSSNKDFIEYAKTEHERSLIFLQYLAEGKLENVRNFLQEKNKCPHKSTILSRTIVLMDATKSMDHLLAQTKNNVSKMFKRVNEILEEYKIDTDCFEVQFACYRDYDCGINGILQASSWETKPDNLRIFMDTVQAYGGEDIPEAIEIGLWHVNQENKKEKVSQVILIGDAPAKDRYTIKDYRRKHGGDELWEKSFGPPTHYLDELQKLSYSNIPVYPFYLHSKAKLNFEEIARRSGTTKDCQYLNVDSNESSEVLTNLVSFHILSNISKSCGKGNDLAEAFNKKFTNTFI